jgi:hypothetical protein
VLSVSVMQLMHGRKCVILQTDHCTAVVVVHVFEQLCFPNRDLYCFWVSQPAVEVAASNIAASTEQPVQVATAVPVSVTSPPVQQVAQVRSEQAARL